MAERHRRYLDDPYVLQNIILEQVTEWLGTLSRADLSPLPQRMRTVLARCQRHVSTIRRELRQQGDAVRQERAREDQEGT